MLIKILKKLVNRNRYLKLLANFTLFFFGQGRYTFIDNKMFSGWGMTTKRMPWVDSHSYFSRSFYDVDNEVFRMVQEGTISLTQFSDINVQDTLKDLRWRHYFVLVAAHTAIRNTTSAKVVFVECGVCDGLTILYAVKASSDYDVDVKTYLYDSWGEMKDEHLLDSEKGSKGKYSYLDINTTMRNLKSIDDNNLVFNKGYIPDIFDKANNPENLNFLHIDLNSARPTIQALDYFWEDLVCGGVVLFDDYAYPGYESTKSAVDEWANSRLVSVIQLPTGQGLIIKDARR